MKRSATNSLPPPQACGDPVNADRVLAVVVTYHPSPDLAAHLRAICSQVDALLVVDNGSPNWRWIEALTLQLRCSLVRNERNEGIAHALNQGVERAQAGGYRWLAMFDQDSSPPADMVAGLLHLVASHPERERVAVVAASYRDRHLAGDQRNDSYVLSQGANWRVMRSLITSGSLVRVDTFSRVGRFDERLFIDFVDHDHCQRLRLQGWLLLQSRDIVLGHAIGRQSTHRFLGRTVHCTNHPPARRYYITRNQLEFYRRYFRTEPRWALWGLLNLALTTLLVVLYEQQRLAKLAAVARGLWHFAIRRFGPLEVHRRP
jgi:rhamnosyltransferase